MSILHTVQCSPFEGSALESCLRMAIPGSGIVLLQDAVYAGVSGTAPGRLLEAAMAAHGVYALAADLEARGIARSRLIPRLEVVDYGGFVDLCVEYSKVQAWL